VGRQAEAVEVAKRAVETVRFMVAGWRETETQEVVRKKLAEILDATRTEHVKLQGTA